MNVGKFVHGDTCLLIFSIGMSMYYTLRPHDRLLIKPYSAREKACKGDVVAFHSPWGEGVVVHRIVRVDAQERIWTKGDNNYTHDPLAFVRGNIIGRVTHVYRGRSKLCIYGGLRGQGQAFLIRFSKYLWDRGHSFLKFLRCQTAIQWLVRAGFTRLLRVRQFTINAADFELHVLLGKKVIGRYVSRQAKWHIQGPYRAFVDTQRLSAGFPVSSFSLH